ncbi:MAG: 16S rRNA (guanine(966)-N(2))-methyltransferase RsmD [Gammaproteobacteria bacterium]|nr:16S rRNA (guanine(966)-N(2))-methyltransferase RsmD [Gammaproteobacteria bacterium]
MTRRQAAGKRKSDKRKSDKGSTSHPGRLRIVAGIWRSRVLEIADVAGLRPTPERVRETLFNWLTPGITGSRCLDLYAGTGALGLEALSRGANEVVFVEKSRRAVTALQRNFEKLDAHGASVQQRDAVMFLNDFCGEPFDIVFLDPPFADDNIAELCRLLAETNSLKSGAKIYVEQDRHRPEPELPAGWSLLKQKTAGNVRYALIAVGLE